MYKVILLSVFLWASDGTNAKNWGAPISSAKPVALDQAIAKFKSNEGEKFMIEGKVEKVCRKKGCWMAFTSAEGPVRVTFKDYGFFVPVNLEGQTITAEGVFSAKQLTLKETKHFIKDEGGDPSKVTEPRQEIQFVATGVALK